MNSRHATLLSDLPSPPRLTARDRGRAWHGGSQFAHACDFRVIDRNDRFRIWSAAEAFERRTHIKCKHGGLLGHSGLAVLRCLLFDFLNMGSGRLDPTYESIAEKTGYARDTVIEAMKRLVLAGIIEKTTRIIRERVKQWCQLTGRMLLMWRTRQTSNAYRVNFPLPDRRSFGDLGAPLLKGCLSKVKAESGNQTVTTPNSYSSKTTGLEAIQDPALRASLASIRASMEAREVKE